MALPFGGWSIDEKCFNWILSHLPDGSTILEFGSGVATGELAKHYTMYSLEDNLGFVEKDYDTHYIYAPIYDGWYHKIIVKRNLPKNYDLILIDGPQSEHRAGILSNASLIDWSKPVVIDDMQHGGILQIAVKIAEEFCKRPYEIIDGDESGTNENKKFMVIP